MNRRLLPKTKYYRPQRAAELRRKAERLERWSPLRVSKRLDLLALLALVLGLLAQVEGYSLLVLALMTISVGLKLLQVRASRLHSQADALEAEHQARYGTLPPGEAH